MDQWYLAAWELQKTINWDAALTLGTCGIVIAASAAAPIRTIYNRESPGKPWWARALLGLALLVACPIGMTLAVVMLGVCSSVVLNKVGIPQGVYSEERRVGFVPYRPTSYPDHLEHQRNY